MKSSVWGSNYFYATDPLGGLLSTIFPSENNIFTCMK